MDPAGFTPDYFNWEIRYISYQTVRDIVNINANILQKVGIASLQIKEDLCFRHPMYDHTFRESMSKKSFRFEENYHHHFRLMAGMNWIIFQMR